MAIAGVLGSVSNAISAATSPVLSINSKDYIHQRQALTKQLGHALQAGDLKAAKAAYDSLTALAKQIGRSNPFSRQDRAADFNAVGAALKTGSLAGAQQAFGVLHDNLQGRSSTPSQTPPGVPPDVIVTINGGGPLPTPAPTPNPKPVPPAPTPSPAPVPIAKPPVPAPTPSPAPPQKLPPVYPNPSTNEIPEIVLNLADNGKGSSNSPTEIVLNLNGGSGAQNEQISIGISQTSSGEQISLSIGGNGKPGTSPSIQLNLGSTPSELDIAVSQTSTGEQIAFSFGSPKQSAVSAFSSGTGGQSASSGLSVSA